jgi:hypothetical protein
MTKHFNRKSNNKNSKVTFESDYKLGINNEKKFQKLMKNKFKINLKETDRYCFYDFYEPNKNIILELKSRKIKKNAYPTTIFGYNKIEKFRKMNQKYGGKYKFIFVFAYEDGIRYFVHSEKYKYKKNMYQRNQIPGIVDKPKMNVFIPINELKDISKIKEEFEPKPTKLLVKYNI